MQHLFGSSYTTRGAKASAACAQCSMSGRWAMRAPHVPLSPHPPVVIRKAHHGRDVRQVGGHEGCALHCAAEHGSSDVISLLITYGAEPRIRSGRHETAAQVACIPRRLLRFGWVEPQPGRGGSGGATWQIVA